MSNSLRTYPVAERFKSVQGEGLYTGTPMAFIRFVGCSVGKSVCMQCDTDFDKPYPHLNGGLLTAQELLDWAHPLEHICFTGGEPFDRDLEDLCNAFWEVLPDGGEIHFETSGTKKIPSWVGNTGSWLTVSPKPGYREDVIAVADEVKVILGGLGDGPGWPTLEDAIRWAEGRTVYIQPRNGKYTVDREALLMAQTAVLGYPQLRLSVQMHKFLEVR